MPTRPTNFRPAQGAGSRAEALERRRAFDRQRRAETETRRLYGTARWQAKRAHQLSLEPLCRMCRAEQRIAVATVADHVEPHRGDVEAFWSNELQSLCDWHHNAAKQAEERAAARDGEGASKVQR